MAADEITLSPAVQAKLIVLGAALMFECVLLAQGFAPVTATWIAIASMVGAVEVSCRLVPPTLIPPALPGRIGVVLAILVVVVHLLSTGMPPWMVVVLVLGVAFVITESARRLTGVPYRLPKIVY